MADKHRPHEDRAGHGHDHDHDHAHGHGHHHHAAPEGDFQLALAVAVNVGLTVVQVIGGIFSGSLALIADAVHNLSDAAALVIAFWARKIARRPRDEAMSFGYGRAELVAALVNLTALIGISLYLAFEGIMRLFDPPEVAGWTVVIVAAVALAVDLATAALTWKLSRESINIRAAFLHNLADAAGSAAVIVSGALILLFGWRLADPLITLMISGYILWHALRDFRPVVRILMLGSPPGMDMHAVRSGMEQVPGVSNVHHMHLWQIDERRVSLEAHVVIADGHEGGAVLRDVKAELSKRYGIGHSTLEAEAEGAGCAAPSAP